MNDSRAKHFKRLAAQRAEFDRAMRERVAFHRAGADMNSYRNVHASRFRADTARCPFVPELGDRRTTVEHLQLMARRDADDYKAATAEIIARERSDAAEMARLDAYRADIDRKRFDKINSHSCD